MEQITISVPFAEELVKAEGKKILQDHMAELWSIIPADLKEDVLSVLTRMVKEQGLTASNIIGALYGAVECMALHWDGKL